MITLGLLAVAAIALGRHVRAAEPVPLPPQMPPPEPHRCAYGWVRFRPGPADKNVHWRCVFCWKHEPPP